MTTAVVTGASSGIGRATAAALRDAGFTVIGTARDPATVPDPVPGVDLRTLDLTDPDSITSFAAEAGPVDVLVNNAGESQAGPFEELPFDALERLFTTNVLGPVELTQLLLPGMRERRSGRIVFIGSMLASFPLAYRSSYVATKAAIRGFSDAAREELSPFGIAVTTVEPGSINTGLSARRTTYLNPDSPHREDFDTVLRALRRNEAKGVGPERVAATIVRAIRAKSPRALYATGSKAPAAFALRRLLTPAALARLAARTHDLRR
ncbi:SDR family oxidoreductase [Actinokineospora pegani]|uniref:SDR family oxidoreductase n=1 Tax=Actinokineospora pegani TaxID=2654637 RepID=UPI0012EAB0EA|nr:SDR family oxidoreductase [Actinokineospora pegani]